MIILAACDERFGIGYRGKLPWKIPSELKHFRETTMGKKVIVGRTTFDGIGPLPGREWYVVSNRSVDGATQIGIEDAKKMNDAIVIGGASIYEQLIPFAERIILSVVRGVYPADTYFPEFHGWEMDWREDRGDFVIFEYSRGS